MPPVINNCIVPHTNKCKKTTVEVINDVYGGATEPIFPSAIKGSIHIVQYTDALVFYVKGTDGVWTETIELPVGELRISLNDSTPTFTPLDVNNPTTAEVDAWTTANLSGLDLSNGTQVVYFVDDYFLPQEDITVTVYQDVPGSEFTSFIVNGDELITTPIPIKDLSENYVYAGQLKTLFDEWLITSGITATFEDLSSSDDENFRILNILGNLEVEITFSYDPSSLTFSDQSLQVLINGDGGSADNPDYIWTLNNGEITLSNKRVFNTKTVYVDAGSGSDVTGKRGYREFPFKTIEGGYAVLQDKDVLHFLPGEYSTSGNFFKVAETLNIHLESGATIIKTGSSNNLFGLAVRDSNYSALTGTLNITGSGTIKNQTTALTEIVRYPHNSTTTVELDSVFLEAGSNQSWGFNNPSRNQNLKIKNAYLNNNKLLGAAGSFGHVGSPGTNDELPQNIHHKIENVFVSNQGTRGAIYRLQNYKTPKNSTVSVEIGNVVFDNTCSSLASTLMMQADGSQPLQDCTIDVKINNITNQRTGITPYSNYESVSSNTKNGEYGFGGAQNLLQPYTNTTCNFSSENIYTTGDIIAFRGIVFSQSKINVSVKNGISLNCAALTFADPHLSNGTVATFDCNLETKANNPCAILYYPGIDGTSKAVLKGSYKTSAAGTATIQIATGSASGRLYLEDCTLINDGTVANITTNSVTPITIVCKNVFMNSVINDPNINLVGVYYQNAINA